MVPFIYAYFSHIDISFAQARKEKTASSIAGGLFSFLGSSLDLGFPTKPATKFLCLPVTTKRAVLWSKLGCEPMRPAGTVWSQSGVAQSQILQLQRHHSACHLRALPVRSPPISYSFFHPTRRLDAAPLFSRQCGQQKVSCTTF